MPLQCQCLFNDVSALLKRQSGTTRLENKRNLQRGRAGGGWSSSGGRGGITLCRLPEAPSPPPLHSSLSAPSGSSSCHATAAPPPTPTVPPSLTPPAAPLHSCTAACRSLASGSLHSLPLATSTSSASEPSPPAAALASNHMNYIFIYTKRYICI